MTNIGLVPIRNFAVVDPDKKIYRSAQPMYGYEYAWLKNRLGLKHIVNPRSELNHDEKFAKAAGIDPVTYNVQDHFPPTLEQANEFIKLVKENTDILFHCEHGHGRTSTFCVLARLATGLSLEDALTEERELYGYEFKHQDQLDFLKTNFSTYKN
jgi:protein tyrosine/serine phosphatase